MIYEDDDIDESEFEDEYGGSNPGAPIYDDDDYNYDGNDPEEESYE